MLLVSGSEIEQCASVSYSFYSPMLHLPLSFGRSSVDLFLAAFFLVDVWRSFSVLWYMVEEEGGS